MDDDLLTKFDKIKKNVFDPLLDDREEYSKFLKRAGYFFILELLNFKRAYIRQNIDSQTIRQLTNNLSLFFDNPDYSPSLELDPNEFFWDNITKFLIVYSRRYTKHIEINFLVPQYEILKTLYDEEVIEAQAENPKQCKQRLINTGSYHNTPIAPILTPDDSINKMVQNMSSDEKIISDMYPECKKKNITDPKKPNVEFTTHKMTIIGNISHFLPIQVKRNNRNPITEQNYVDRREIYIDKELVVNGENLKLLGFLVHSGSDGSGHYIAVIRTQDNNWYVIDDDKKIDPVHDINTYGTNVSFLMYLNESSPFYGLPLRHELTGIPNQGATCWFNASLQLFVNIKKLWEWLIHFLPETYKIPSEIKQLFQAGGSNLSAQNLTDEMRRMQEKIHRLEYKYTKYKTKYHELKTNNQYIL